MINQILQSLGSHLWSLLRPSSLLVEILLLGLILHGTRWRSLGHKLILGGTLLLGLIAVLPLGHWAIGGLEALTPPGSESGPVAGIVVLGGAVRPELTQDWGMPALTDGAERMTSAVALARRHPEAKLIFTGGIAPDGEKGLTEADVARLFFSQMGLDVSRILFDAEAQTTWDNAKFAKELGQPQAGERWLLVTSAFHMPRAMAAFTKAGWQITPWPVGFKSRLAPSFLPSLDLAEELTLLDYAAHEALGLAAYRLMGRA